MHFLEEFEKLRLKTPRVCNINIGSENSDYCTHSDKNKNCYLLFAANFNEDCYYAGIIVNSRDCVECNYCQFSELCFECIDIDHCYNCSYAQNLQNCSDCMFSYDLIGCQNCFGCCGLRQKNYSFFNEQLSKEEYEKRIRLFDLKNSSVRKDIFDRLEELKHKIPQRAAHILNSENCIGERITRSRNCYACFDANDCEDSYYLQDVWRTKDSADLTFSDGTELCYECFSIGMGCYNCNFSNYIRGSSDLEYCELCFNCKHCFGCVSLQSKEYYILNKPYSAEEYFKKVAEIKAQIKQDGSYGKHLPTTYKYEDTAAVWWK